jgi:hypothetical protein
MFWNDGEYHLDRWREKCSITKSPLIFLDPRTSKAQLVVTLEVTVIKNKEYFNTNTIIIYM